MVIKGTDQEPDCSCQIPALCLKLQTVPCNQSVLHLCQVPGKMARANTCKVRPKVPSTQQALCKGQLLSLRWRQRGQGVKLIFTGYLQCAMCYTNARENLVKVYKEIKLRKMKSFA